MFLIRNLMYLEIKSLDYLLTTFSITSNKKEITSKNK